MTDQFSGYNILDKKNERNFVRLKIDHTVTYSLGDGIHTNGIESFGRYSNDAYMECSITYQSSIYRSM